MISIVVDKAVLVLAMIELEGMVAVVALVLAVVKMESSMVPHKVALAWAVRKEIHLMKEL